LAVLFFVSSILAVLREVARVGHQAIFGVLLIDLIMRMRV